MTAVDADAVYLQHQKKDDMTAPGYRVILFFFFAAWLFAVPPGYRVSVPRRTLPGVYAPLLPLCVYMPE